MLLGPAAFLVFILMNLCRFDSERGEWWSVMFEWLSQQSVVAVEEKGS